MNRAAIPVTLIGHPFANVGMGEQLRSHMAALRAVHVEFKSIDILRHAARKDPEHLHLVGSTELDRPPGGIRIFHINGDEVDRVRAAFEERGGRFADGYNVIVPAWELARYPGRWAQKLRAFDEVWALSRFIAQALEGANIASQLVGQSVEVPRGYFFPRRYFGLRESAFVILHFFDLTSYATRKNPEAVLRMFDNLRQRARFRDMQLVLKVKSADEDGAEWLGSIRERVPEAVCLAKPLSSLEVRSLINSADCFASLHRSEGFGRGLGEAMFLGRLALGTGYSGNTDFMTSENSLLVNHRLVPVQRGAYPHASGQVWADADVEHARDLLETAIKDPELARRISARGRREITAQASNRAVGLRILDRITAIGRSMTKPVIQVGNKNAPRVAAAARGRRESVRT